ncbi:hypothetical protein R1sor_004544 [Riccia sorocarpa]|uniref:Uncharacterized protein n=1 Tax=Riccia sorocarpa TaxID=122646 RepID=A0ABD3HHK0_9MARC
MQKVISQTPAQVTNPQVGNVEPLAGGLNSLGGSGAVQNVGCSVRKHEIKGFIEHTTSECEKDAIQLFVYDVLELILVLTHDFDTYLDERFYIIYTIIGPKARLEEECEGSRVGSGRSSMEGWRSSRERAHITVLVNSFLERAKELTFYCGDTGAAARKNRKEGNGGVESRKPNREKIFRLQVLVVPSG